MRYTGPRNRLARREGIDLGLKSVGSKAQSNLLRKLSIIPGQHGHSRMSKPSDYGIQLREKQKLKRIYGMTEKQMKIFFLASSKKVGNTAEHLINILEKRLDNAVFKLGFAPTRAAARQLVAHGHILINDKKTTIPSYIVSQGDEISFRRKKSIKIPYIAQILEKKDFIVSPWMIRQGPVGKVVSDPDLTHFQEDVNLQSVVEFYSR
ncbi:30S ribosomal protein S4 [Candidatus Roizmanbacteria bacterium RIFCSPHIGHO2_01_FULL_39_12b]|uniref:Small ribosomal subunit protein uS4 n=1 Tax=Candidatus Roizmanbacteria bacterium RIFCSPHIGHO2_01_FULL_39_12b TaxID=1802030 RepID=A0A1F7GD02_9BACT|nr:MAG: 30S ribosomal protein S4 [Candidatus Roizmanbacteria bacterium RIFCSPHIGHO2_01_FULL_39_12b]OGK47082.1 MAG: 30S ribosomal protein S4 [Candidatus Roizmanbacteria bacterium RIFCSPLOWO2_01_FULL_39_19]